MTRRSFAAGLGVIAAVALIVRLVYVYTVARHLTLGLDSIWYELVSGPLAHGKGVIDPVPYFTSGREVATAGHPPLYPAFLAVVTRVANNERDTFLVAGALAGTVTVVLVGCIGRRIAGPYVGLVAAALAAGFPSLIAVDGALMSETLSIPLLLAGVLATMHARAHPSWWRWALAGVLFGLMTLTRADAVVPAVLVLGPTIWLAAPNLRRRAVFGAVALGAFLLVVLPWLVRNEVQVRAFTVTTTSSAITVEGANCATTYHGPLVGYWDPGCVSPNDRGLSEHAYAAAANRHGIDYARRHARRWPLVVAVRELRVLGLYHPRAQTRLDAIESRSYHFQVLAWACWLPVMVLGVLGMVRLVRMRRPVWPLLAVLVALFVIVALSYGNQRFRTAAEPVMLVAAAAAIVPRRLHATLPPAASPAPLRASA